MKEHAGEVIIEIGADTNDFDKKVDKIEKRLNELDKKKNTSYEYNGVRIEGEVYGLTDEEEAEYEKLYEEYEKLYEEDLERVRAQERINETLKEQEATVDEIADLGNEMTNGLALDLEKMFAEYKGILSEFRESGIINQADLDRAEELKEKIKETAAQIEEMTGQKLIIKGITDTQEEIKEVKDSVKSIDGVLKKVGNGINKVIKNVIRWGLAILGIRGAYMAVRNAMNVVMQGDEKLKADIDYMKTALAYAFEPVIRKIIDWMKILVFYVAYLIRMWTGNDIFASADRHLQKSVGSAKELKNQLTGFDEMTVLGDNSSGGAGGIDNSIMDEWKDFKPPEWLDKFGKKVKEIAGIISKYWKVAVGVLAAGVAILLGLKIFKFFKDLKTGGDIVKGVGTSFTGFFDGLGKGIEAIAILGGFALVIREITGLIDTFAQSGLSLTDVIGLMGTVIGSLVVLIAALTIAANALQSPLAMGGLVLLTAAIVAVLLIIKETLPTILDALGKFITEVGPTLNMILETIGENIEKIIYALGTALPPIIESIGNLFEKIFNGISKVIETVGTVIVNIMNTAKSLVIEVLNAIIKFINELGPAINRFVDNAIVAVTKLINFMISGIEYMINTLVINAVRGLVRKINETLPGEEFDLNMPSYVQIERFRPRLAKGGIINLPGRGVPVGNAIGGERGAEGVIPLTDSQQMALLGEAIGKYITINATITNTMNGRVISRELQKINAEDDFAYNR